MDRARVKLGDKVMIPAVVEKIEYTTEGGVSYKVKPIITTWFDAGEIEALRESTDKYTNATTNLYDSRLAKDLIGISKEAEKLWTFEGVAESVAPKEMSLEEWQEIDRMVQGVAESATTTDCISRKDAIEVVTRAIRDKFSLADWYEQLLEAGEEIEALIESLPPVASKPVTDCISRQQVTDEIKRWRGYLDEDMIERINTRMNMLPPVTPTERTGEWVNSKGEPVNDRYSVYCSRCKAWSEYRDIYCGNCGAKMGGDDNE